MDKGSETLCELVAEMRSKMLRGPLGKLKRWIAAGAQTFSDPDYPRVEIANLAAEIGTIARESKRAIMAWRPSRVRDRDAAIPIALDRHERAEDFLKMIEAFLAWTEEAEQELRGDRLGAENWKNVLLEAFDRITSACRTLRREVWLSGPDSI